MRRIISQHLLPKGCFSRWHTCLRAEVASRSFSTSSLTLATNELPHLTPLGTIPSPSVALDEDTLFGSDEDEDDVPTDLPESTLLTTEGGDAAFGEVGMFVEEEDERSSKVGSSPPSNETIASVNSILTSLEELSAAELIADFNASDGDEGGLADASLAEPAAPNFASGAALRDAKFQRLSAETQADADAAISAANVEDLEAASIGAPIRK